MPHVGQRGLSEYVAERIRKCNSPIAKNISLTFIAVFADVSINRRALSSAYD